MRTRSVISLNVYQVCCSHYGFLIFLLMGLEIKLSGRAKALDSILSSGEWGSGQGGDKTKSARLGTCSLHGLLNPNYT